MANKGRPSKFTQAIADEICCRLAEGESLLAICRDDHMPPESTVRGWDKDNVQNFSAKYARAREIGDDVEFERLGSLAAEQPPTVKGFTDAGWVSWKKNQIDTHKWMLARKRPKKYGDKVTHAGDSDTPLEIVIRRIGGGNGEA